MCSIVGCLSISFENYSNQSKINPVRVAAAPLWPVAPETDGYSSTTTSFQILGRPSRNIRGRYSYIRRARFANLPFTDITDVDEEMIEQEEIVQRLRQANTTSNRQYLNFVRVILSLSFLLCVSGLFVAIRFLPFTHSKLWKLH